MEEITRIQPFIERKDKEFEPYLQFLKDVVLILEPNFQFFETFLEEDREDKPYESLIVKTKYGTKEQGFEVIHSQVYEQIANNIAVDCVIVRAYGLKNDKLEIRSVREQDDLEYIELSVVSTPEITNEITKKFNQKFKSAHLTKERLKKELLILNTSLKRKAWYAVEMRAKSILKDFPDEPHALFALAIARVAQGDMESKNEIIEHIYKLKPDKPDELYNIGMIHKQREEYEEALATLQKSIKVESESDPVQRIVSQVQAALSEVNDALDTYEKAIKT
ncbi:MAG: outer membrane protein assembly factor BamD [Asgard group archaeon]|nr:outer membrane protein assembly factor BamD [Asgard group archaeon]